jgi:hypothetical protein
MTLRFVRAQRVAGADEDWILYSGQWQVGDIGRSGGQDRKSISWSLTGPVTPEARVAKGGSADHLLTAQVQLVAAFKHWAAWAGIRPEGTEAPRWLRAPTASSYLEPSFDTSCDWLLVSGGYTHIGRVCRPLAGPRHDPHWTFRVMTAPDHPPFQTGGWAETDEDAKAQLIGAWRNFLKWAELPVPPESVQAPPAEAVEPPASGPAV